MSIFRHIDSARHIFPGERCGHCSSGPRCQEAAAYWLVSDDNRAIVAYCQPHANAAPSEFHAAAEHPEDERLAVLALWRIVPVTMAGGAA